jgi:hypothetical protein
MATYSIKSFCLVLTLAGAALPVQALAGPAANTANAPVEIWDVMAPRAEVKPSVSHIDIAPGQSFDAPGTIIPMTIKIPSRADFTGPVQSSEIWDVVRDDPETPMLRVPHIDILPGQSLDIPAAYAPPSKTPLQTASTRTTNTPDA